MEISLSSSMSNSVNYTQPTVSEVVETSRAPIQLPQEDNAIKAKEEDQVDRPEVSADEARKVSAEMNKFMKLLNSSIRFMLHKGTNTMIVQVVDSKDNTVLKEFPPHELLDTRAKIREYVGILLDRHI